MNYGKLSIVLATLFTLLLQDAIADWNSAPETLVAGHPTWIYIPENLMPSKQRGLLVVLHGCDQSANDLKVNGDLVPTANKYGLVLALPDVGSKAWPGYPPWINGANFKCWDYDGGTDTSGEITAIVELAKNLQKRLSIDPAHVYIVGLSSGGALALDAACKAPDIFSGVGAIASPSVGSFQATATSGPLLPLPAVGIDPTQVAQLVAVDQCTKLAGSKRAYFATQIANIAFGEMDKGGSDAQPLSKHPGQIAVIPIVWNTINLAALREIYGTDAWSSEAPVQGRQAFETIGWKDGKPRLSFLKIPNVGHAWPAGGKDQTASSSSLWIAHTGFSYPQYIAPWFLKNNLRQEKTLSSAPSAKGQPCRQFISSNYNHYLNGRATQCGAYACAVGSGDNLGLLTMFASTTVSTTGSDIFQRGGCKKSFDSSPPSHW